MQDALTEIFIKENNYKRTGLSTLRISQHRMTKRTQFNRFINVNLNTTEDN